MCHNLTSGEIQILNSLCGTRDQPNADVLFFGNEEDFGRNNIQNVINERIYLFNNFNLPIDGDDTNNGHYYLDRLN